MKYKAILFDLDFTLYDECQFFKAAVISSRLFDNVQDVISKITYRLRINSNNIIDDLLDLEDKLNKQNKDHMFSIMKNIDLKFECYRGRGLEHDWKSAPSSIVAGSWELGSTY